MHNVKQMKRSLAGYKIRKIGVYGNKSDGLIIHLRKIFSKASVEFVSKKEALSLDHHRFDVAILSNFLETNKDHEIRKIIENLDKAADIILVDSKIPKSRYLKNERVFARMFQKKWRVDTFLNNSKRVFLVGCKRRSVTMILPDHDDHFPRDSDRYQYHTYVKVLKYLKGHKTAVDIGGHVGFYSRAMSEHFESVVAFEPSDESYNCFVRNCPDVTCHKTALGAEKGEIYLNIEKGNSGNTYATEGKGTPISTLDSYSIDNVDLIKIDVQGFEGDVMRGAIKTIKASQPILIVELELEGRINEKAKEFIMKEFNYKIYERAGKDFIMGPA